MAAPDPVHLLDLEPDLAWRLREDDRAEAREHLVLRTVELPQGEWSLTSDTHPGRPFGLIVIDGLLLQEVLLGDRRSHRLLGRGDVVLPHRRIEATLDADPRLIVAMPSRVALLDDRLQGPFALWPGLALGLLEQAGRQLTRAAVQAAIAQLPRVEDRLEATFWELGDRWGRVTGDGIHVPLGLTHETLARIVGGRRPTISLALTQLDEQGIVRRRADGTWLVTATAPSLATAVATDSAPPLTVALPAAPPERQDAPYRRAWSPDLRSEMLATARRAVAQHRAARERVRADALRYEETRRRSRQIREAAARTRDARRDGRDAEPPPLRLTGPAPPAP